MPYSLEPDLISAERRVAGKPKIGGWVKAGLVLPTCMYIHTYIHRYIH